jgi:hypothetical protein
MRFILLLSLTLFLLLQSTASFADAGIEVPLDKPNADIAAVISWSAITVPDVMTFSSDNYRERIPKSARYFTQQGWESFALTLQKTGAIDAANTPTFSVSVKPASSPALIQQGPLRGRYRWVVKMPLRLDFKAGQDSHTEKILLNVVIEHVVVTDSPTGLAISLFSFPKNTALNAQVMLPIDNPEIAAFFSNWPGPLVAGTNSRPQSDAPLDQPNMDDDELVFWAADAATRAAHLTYMYENVFSDTAHRVFTTEGWKGFEAALADEGLIENVKKYKQGLSSAPSSKPVIVLKQAVEGRFQWIVTFKLVETARANCKRKTTDVPVTLTIVRVPVAQSPRGVAINRWDGASQFKAFSSFPDCPPMADNYVH